TAGFHVVARNGNDGSLVWDDTTDWTPTTYNWYPAYQPVYVPSLNRVYFAGANGTLYYRTNADSNSGTKTQINISYPISTGNFIMTGLTADNSGNIYFGYVNGTSTGGIVKVTPAGTATIVSCATASGDSTTNWPQYNASFALSNDQSTLYVTVRNSTN